MSGDTKGDPPRRVVLGGAEVDLIDAPGAVELIARRLREPDGRPLGVVSVNLDHLHHLAHDDEFAAALDGRSVDWLALIDGAPVAARAGRLTGRPWPRLAGSDLIEPLLARAEADGVRFGVVGGSVEAHAELRRRVVERHPALIVAGTWAPDREDLSDPIAARRLAAEIADARVDLLLIALGKPRQEIWIDAWGPASGARVLLAFGAVVDFLAGTVTRAPAIVSRAGMEWAWRLMLEPRRLARRYLVNGLPALRALRRHSSLVPLLELTAAHPGSTPPRFRPAEEAADVAVVVVTYRNADDVDPLVATLRREAVDLRLRVVVVDNSSTDGTLDRVRAHEDVIAVPAGGNVGYAGGINVAMRHVGEAEAVLVLNPDLTVVPGAIRIMLERMRQSAAAVVVPLMTDPEGRVSVSLRREPSITRAIGDAVLGGRLPGRAGAWTEIDGDRWSYRYPHQVEWATGAALLVRTGVARLVGEWDERFFLYSEETDFFRRVRERGGSVWFEPRAVVRHEQGGSGSSPDLTALLAVNKVRYVEKHHAPAYAAAFRGASIVHELLRLPLGYRAAARRAMLRRRRWPSLPAATRDRPERTGSPIASIVIPAHDEATVIDRTLAPFAPWAADGLLEVIVSCNGCRDDTAERARRHTGVRVLEIPESSKAAALNAADAVATAWPRIYLDADIETRPDTLLPLIGALDDGQPAGRPPFRYDTTGASAIVRAYYRARSRVPSLNRALWGAGIYALSRVGHERLGSFPDAVGDDLHVDRLFAPDEKRIIGGEPVVVRTPRTPAALLAVLRRARRGADQQGVDTGASTGRDLLASIRGPRSAWDAVVYVVVTLRARSGRPDPAATWERDDSSR
ncbi:WecB/TagA/CpsF family glycosyltransferase [Pseudolysinimonas sp.]|uniref:WecB/TagA/CpsF family glycosyltransferase n=1 Tax=Pseudolysinimonas sp. TaxID=2680009 RepID=UPI003F7E51CA